jgi:phasin family protein
MADPQPSFFNFDVTKLFAFRPFDMEAAWAAQRRNIEALSQANQLAVEGAQALARRQIELTREAFEEMATLLRDLALPVSAEDRIAKQTEYTKHMIEKGVSHGREVVMLATKTGSEAAAVLHKRTNEGLDELRALACKSAA